MKEKFCFRIPVLGVMLGMFSSLWAAGYQVNLQSTQRIGMGNAGSAYAPGASSLFYNPGAMGMVKTTDLSVGGSLIFAQTDYKPLKTDAEQTGWTSASTQTDFPGTPFFLYAAHRIKNQGEITPWTVGVGVFSPFGSSVEWGNDWAGRKNLQKIALQSFYVQPTVAYQILDGLSIGAGVDIVWGNMNLEKRVLDAGEKPVNSPDNIDILLNGNAGVAFGYNIGAFWQVSPMVSLGLSYRSSTKISVNQGTVNYTNVTDPLLPLFPNDNHFDAALSMPAVLTYGMGFTCKKFAVAFDVNYIFWSVYKELALDFEQSVGGAPVYQAYKRNYKDSWIFNLGAEYFVLPILTVRAGTYYDMSPVRKGYMTPETPDADTIGATVGLGVKLWKGLSLDAAFLYIHKMSRESQTLNNQSTNDVVGNIRGNYQSNGYIPSLALNYKF